MIVNNTIGIIFETVYVIVLVMTIVCAIGLVISYMADLIDWIKFRKEVKETEHESN